MTTKTKTKLALLAFAKATKQLITNPFRFAVSIFDAIITPFAQYEQEVQKTSSIPEELKFAYQRDWTYTTLSDVRSESAKKRWNAKSMQS